MANNLLPSLTGNPALDSILTKVAASLGGALAAIAVPWLVKHGVAGIDAGTITEATASVVLTVVAVVWGLAQKNGAEGAVVQHALDAAATGTVTPAVAAAANPVQLIQAKALQARSAQQKQQS